MIKVTGRSKKQIDTYYNKTFEDDAQEFTMPSLTDQSYLSETNIYNILERGGVAARPLQFGEQNYDTLEELLNSKKEWELSFYALSDEDRAKFNNNLLDYIDYVSNPANYTPLVPLSPAEEKKEPEKVEETEK